MFHFLRGIACSIQKVAETRITRFGMLLLVLFCSALQGAWAKDIPITGVLVYPAGGGYGYVQVTGFLVNGKTELRACTAGAGVDKSSYKNMAKIALASVKTLERMPDGTLMAELGEAPATCVVPGNFKFDKEGILRPSELVDKSVYAGQVVGSLPAGVMALPALAPGSKFVFGSATDAELAQYLLADRSQTIPVWHAYLDKYTNAPHAGQARASLVTLLVQDGTLKLASYVKSAGSPAPAYSDLKAARERADQALDLVASDASAIKLRDGVRAQLKDISDRASAKLQSFKAAMAAHTHGYDLLVSARDLSAHAVDVDGKYAPGVTVQNNTANEIKALDAAVQSANAQRALQQYDNAYASIGKYVSFSTEEPRLGEIVRDAYKFHMDKADAEVGTGDWAGAVADLHRASEIDPTDEAKAATLKAEAGLAASQDKLAAEHAQVRSKTYLDDQDVIGAYEVLANLTDSQRLLVKDDMAALQDKYVVATTVKAKDLQASHTPIRGRADEDAVRQAYDYLQRASKLSDNPDIGIKLDLVADEISTYYVGLGDKYLAKPLSSGVGLGWGYLTEALQYRPNLETVRDDETRNNAAYQMRAKLSISVLFRDQTSRRDSAGFADQLQQAFATGLETSGLPVKVVLPGAAGTLEPNFQFVGEILQHRTIRNAKKDTLQSEYRSGSREVPNDLWNKADQEYEAANLDLQRQQSALSAAQAKNNKKMIEEANRTLDKIQETVQQTRAKMNAIPKTVTDNVVSPYNYTQTTLELTNIVELSFRIIDSTGAVIGEPTHVIKGDKPKKFTILENIKPDDTKGLREIDSVPDETQLMNDVEIEARDTMVKTAQERVQALPEKILAQARAQVAASDFDGAGESYVLYLNCTAAKETPERTEAAHFLTQNFNLRHAVELSASVQ